MKGKGQARETIQHAWLLRNGGTAVTAVQLVRRGKGWSMAAKMVCEVSEREYAKMVKSGDLIRVRDDGADVAGWIAAWMEWSLLPVGTISTDLPKRVTDGQKKRSGNAAAKAGAKRRK